MKYLVAILFFVSCTSQKKTLTLDRWSAVTPNKRLDTVLVSTGIYKVTDHYATHNHIRYYSTDPNIYVSPFWIIEK